MVGTDFYLKVATAFTHAATGRAYSINDVITDPATIYAIQSVPAEAVKCTRITHDQLPKGSTRYAVTGSRGGNAALASLIAALVSAGLITDGTTT